ncbi:hypothetical protein [Streptomyces sp. NPDC007172]|uniref:hypothetical protein n=1 Tax=Streptomyces sp. NPDC007172 TaxID=3364776 RepID=UPI0036ABC8F8
MNRVTPADRRARLAAMEASARADRLAFLRADQVAEQDAANRYAAAQRRRVRAEQAEAAWPELLAAKIHAIRTGGKRPPRLLSPSERRAQLYRRDHPLA